MGREIGLHAEYNKEKWEFRANKLGGKLGRGNMRVKEGFLPNCPNRILVEGKTV